MGPSTMKKPREGRSSNPSDAHPVANPRNSERVDHNCPMIAAEYRTGFQPSSLRANPFPGASPQAGITTRLWRWPGAGAREQRRLCCFLRRPLWHEFEHMLLLAPCFQQGCQENRDIQTAGLQPAFRCCSAVSSTEDHRLLQQRQNICPMF